MNDQPKEKDARTQQIEDRKKRIKELNPPLPRVRVIPASEEMRRALRHPTGHPFPATGSAEWPLDQFTRRRIKDGSVTREEAEQRDERHERGRRRPSEPPPEKPAA